MDIHKNQESNFSFTSDLFYSEWTIWSFKKNPNLNKRGEGEECSALPPDFCPTSIHNSAGF